MLLYQAGATLIDLHPRHLVPLIPINIGGPELPANYLITTSPTFSPTVAPTTSIPTSTPTANPTSIPTAEAPQSTDESSATDRLCSF